MCDLVKMRQKYSIKVFIVIRVSRKYFLNGFAPHSLNCPFPKAARSARASNEACCIFKRKGGADAALGFSAILDVNGVTITEGLEFSAINTSNANKNSQRREETSRNFPGCTRAHFWGEGCVAARNGIISLPQAAENTKNAFRNQLPCLRTNSSLRHFILLVNFIS